MTRGQKDNKYITINVNTKKIAQDIEKLKKAAVKGLETRSSRPSAQKKPKNGQPHKQRPDPSRAEPKKGQQPSSTKYTAAPSRGAVPVMSEKDQQSRTARKLQLDQQTAGIVGGKTGLMMLLDAMLNEKDQNAFSFYADAYIQQMKRLNSLLKRYEEIRVSGRDIQKYRDLLEIGSLLQKLSSSKEQTEEETALFRKKAEEWFDHYSGGGDAV